MPCLETHAIGFSRTGGALLVTQVHPEQPTCRSTLKRILRKHGYPPGKQEAATNTVLQQAELLSDFWVGGR